MHCTGIRKRYTSTRILYIIYFIYTRGIYELFILQILIGVVGSFRKFIWLRCFGFRASRKLRLGCMIIYGTCSFDNELSKFRLCNFIYSRVSWNCADKSLQYQIYYIFVLLSLYSYVNILTTSVTHK